MKRELQFNPSRLTFARKRRGLTKTELADLVMIEPRSVSGYENGEFSPEPEKLRSLAEALRFPTDFFTGDNIEELSPDITSFRAMTKMTSAKRDIALGAGAIARMLNKWIESHFDLPAIDLPDLGREESPEACAETLRQTWGLGELPIKNMVHLLESKGARVFTLAIDAAEVDAFSMWYDGTPFIFLNTKKSAEHSRFDAAHELGHLVMHRHGAPHGRKAEYDANAFASAFLMPQASIFAQAPAFATIDQLIRLKKYWTVSLAALAYRLRTLGIVSEWHYRDLCVEISRRGYRKKEPDGASREVSQLLAKVFSALRGDGITKVDIARELQISTEEIESLIFGLTITVLTGMATPGNPPTRRKPNLRVIRPGD